MAGRLKSRRIGADNTWPGFVDALSTLLLVIIFLLSMFVLAQFFLGQALSGRDAALDSLKGQLSELSDMLRMEQQANSELRIEVGDLAATLQSAEIDKAELGEQITSLQGEVERTQGLSDETSRKLTLMSEQYDLTDAALGAERDISAAALAEVAKLNKGLTALRQQLANLEAALEASEIKDKEQQAFIVNLGKRLNTALAGKVEELAGYRSEFYGRLRAILGDREDIVIEGDRFIFKSDLLFASGSAELGALGQRQMISVANTLLNISATLPTDVNWILRVDGHTDRVPIFSSRFPSNWELSTARATSVVKFLIGEGVPPSRLAATGFGEYQPIDPANTPDAYRTNRRIEMRFTQR